MGLFKPEIRDKIYYYLMLALVFCLPIHGRLVPPIIGLIALNWIFELNFKLKVKRILKSIFRQIIIAFSIIYFLYILGIFYSSQLMGEDGAWFNLEVKMSLLVFPLLFSTIDYSFLNSKLHKKILQTFVLGCLISGILLINNAFFQYFNSSDIQAFYYRNLSASHHPSYLALYFSFAIIILLDWVLKKREKNIFKFIIAFFLILNFQVFIVLLSSKAGIIGLVLSYLMALVFYLFWQKKKKNALIVITSVLLVFFITNLASPQTYQRFFSAGNAIDNTVKDESVKDEGSVARMQVWKSALEVISKNPIIGVGTGDVIKTLLIKYEENEVVVAIDKELNPHNQYLQTYIAIGIVGFLVLVLMLLWPAIAAIKKRQFLYLIFIVVFAFHLLVESMLERQAGVVYYAFFNVFLFYYAFNKKSSNPQLS